MIRPRATGIMARLDAEASQLWQEAIGVMWMRTCGVCGKQTEAGCGHHIIGKRCKQAKYELMNGIYVCSEPHKKNTASCHDRIHANKKGFLIWLETSWPDLYDWHIKNRNPPAKVRFTHELRETLIYLKQFIKENK